MNMVLLSSLVVLFAIASMVAITPGAFADHTTATVTNAPGSSVPGCEETADGCFIPSPVTINVGGIVTWENNDTAAHTATAGSAFVPSGVFDSSLIMAGSSFSHTFDAAGIFDYFCMVHPWMAGTLIVEEAGAADAAAAEAAAEEAAAAAAGGLTLSATGVEGSTTIDVSGTTDRTGDITLKVTAPNGNVVSVSQISPSGGSFMTTIETGGALWSQDGMYTISAHQGAASNYQTSADVEIIDGHVIPEFGVIAAMILAVAIVSIIVVTAKTRLSLVPRY